MKKLKSLKKQKILFLCTGNSARSQMAEALLKHKAGNQFEVFSAGTLPEQVDERAIDALSKFGLNTSELVSKDISVFEETKFDYVITLCDKANTECRNYPNAKKQLAWDFPDPKDRAGSNAFSVTLNELNNRLSMFLLVEDKALPNANDEQISANSNVTADANAVDSKLHKIDNDLSQFEDENDTLTDIIPTDFFKCLTDEIRLKTLMLGHYHGELCVCELMESLDEDCQPKVSRNLAVLKRARVIVDRKHGQWVFYRINPKLPLWAKSIIAYTTENNIPLISEELLRLSVMKNRPGKSDFCK
ncbi:metalloregulator ArsR/SmtB family transcription factor [Colwellia sp. E2M01]|uniref:metalloregulator ArsR/SmtB family transcription factor n=1 Tax=Colwellia sp. E2M01 TaxID=2841561 RepID=UPI001C08BA61|nr:metalloregulator ArsR/SmtB family transcription factor [Colwellia sp. E2M01]MBU2870540.1 metalloregulator ArsR/SmtB family transcription factor [Colwellia sp. E2M01]